MLALITAAAAWLRFHALAAKSFWLDEGVSVAIARLDWYNFVRILWRREANMSLYYLLLRPWLAVGGSEFWVRSLSVLFAAASIPVLYLLGRRLFDSRTAIVATILLAVNAYHLEYSQDARSYTLMVLLCMLSSLYFLKAIWEPTRANRIAYVALSSLAVYAHFFSGLVVLAQWLALRSLAGTPASDRVKKDRQWIALLVSPALLFVLTTGAGPLRWVHRPRLHDLWVLAVRFSGNGGWPLLLAYAAACLVGLAATRHAFGISPVPWNEWKSRFVWTWLLFPPLFLFIVSQAKPLFVFRYFIACLPALFLLAANGLARLRSRALIATATVAFVGLSLPGVASEYRQDCDIDRDDWRAATQFLLNHAQPGDAVLFHIPMGRMPYDFYAGLPGHTPSQPFVAYPRHAERVTFLDFVEKPDYPRLEVELARSGRAWLVLSYAETAQGLPDTRSTELSGLLSRLYRQVDREQFRGVELVLYSGPGPR